MSVERMQTVMQFATSGADAVIQDINRIVAALRQASGGDTALGRLSPTASQSFAGVKPAAFNQIEGLQAAQVLANRKLTDAIKREADLRTRALGEKETAEGRAAKLRVAENASIAAGIRENKARQSLADALYGMLPDVQERARQEKLGAAMARDFVREQNARESARKSLDRQRQRAYDTDFREQESARKSLDRQRQAAYNEQFRREMAEADRVERQRVAQARTSLADEEKWLNTRDKARRDAKIADAQFAFGQLPSDNALSQSEISRLVASPTRQAGDTDRVYRAREILADATTAHALAESKLARAVETGRTGDPNKTKEQLAEAINRQRIAYDTSGRTMQRAQDALTIALRNEAVVHAENTRRSVREDFITGFRGRGQTPAPYGEQLGQAFKFSIFYGTAYKLLFGLTQTLSATFQEGVAFQDGMTNLALATERPKEELNQIANDLAASATRAGFAPSQGVEIGARSLGLYGVTDSDQATQDRVMQISSRVVNQLAVGSQKTPVDLQGDIAAIGQALGMGAAGQFRIADLDAYMTKKFGVAQGSTLDVVAQSASVGKAAGFSDEQLFAIAADLLSRTGQSGSAVSGYMAQIFSRGGEGSLVNVAKAQGIDANQDLATILAQLAQVYQTASGPEQAEISAAFGRGKIQNAAVALLGDYDEVLKRSGQALTDASGQADEQFKIRMNNIGGQVDLLMGVMREFASQMGESGLLDVVGLGIVTLREFLEVVNGVLKLWNQLPNAIQDTIIALTALSIAAKSGALSSFGANAMARSGTGGRLGVMYGPAGAVRNYVSTPTGVVPMGTRVIANSSTGSVVPLASRAGASAIATAGRAALATVAPFGIAIGGLMAIGALKNSADRMRSATDQGITALTAPSAGPGSSSTEFQAYASELKSLATQSRESTGWFMNAVTFGSANDDNVALADRLDAEATRIEGIAQRMAAEESRAATPERLAFASLSADDISTGLSALEAGGATASEQLKALRDVLFGTADAADQAAAAFKPRDFAQQGAGNLVGAIAESLKDQQLTAEDVLRVTPPAPAGFNAGSGYGTTPSQSSNFGTPPIAAKNSTLRKRFEEALSATDVQERYQQAFKDFGIGSAAEIPAQADEMAAQIGRGVAEAALKPLGAKGGVIRKYQEKINAAIATQLIEQANAVKELISGDSPLTTDEATAAAINAVQLSEGSMSNLAEVDTAGQVKSLRTRIRTLTRIQRRTRDPIGIIQEQITLARRQIAESQFNELERLRRIAQRNADSKAEIADIGQGFMRREIRAAIRGGNDDLLVKILEQAGKGAAAFARKVIRDAIEVVNAAFETAILLNSVGQEIDGMVRGAAAGWREGISEEGAEGVNGPLRKRRRELNKALNAIDQSLSARGDDNVYGSGSDSGNPILDKESEEAKKDKDSPAEIAAAKASAFATRSQSAIAAARAAIMSARASLADAKKNTVEYWNAMGELFAAQQQLTDAVQAYRLNQMRLRGDITNPLFEARVATREAAMRLRADRASGAGPDVIAQDRIDVREARANQESTAFSQRLQAVQTAEELGRISHSKYINYLENEKRRLEGIKNRTFQQQEQLDQIDRLMKDAANQMQGQFNLGDIKLPTPYQVRRYIEQTSPSRTERMAAANVSNAYLTMHNYGANPPEIEKTVRRVVGKAGRVRTPAPRRR